MEGTATKLIVTGGSPLHGQVRISGMKNAALPILFACLLNKCPCIIRNLPRVTDIDCTLRILEDEGCVIRHIDPETIEIDSSNATYGKAREEDVQRLRGSVYLMGSELGRFGHSKISQPGGCNFAARPIDLHKRAFSSMGAIIMDGQQSIYADAEFGDRLHGGKVSFDFPSVGATCNAILAATMAEGVTTIENAAREPHIVDLANFLNTCGADIRGAGTSNIRIRGVESLHGCTYTIIPDMIEAGTFLAMVAGTGGDVTITDVIPAHLSSVISKLQDMGVRVEDLDDAVRIQSDGTIDPVNINVLPYPGFPTDMQPQFAALLSICFGECSIKDDIFPTRFQYAEALNKMGAQIAPEQGHATITGVKYLNGAKVHAPDLRAAAALLIAALMAKGESEITGIDKLKRGYEDIVDKLHALGATVREEKI